MTKKGSQKKFLSRDEILSTNRFASGPSWKSLKLSQYACYMMKVAPNNSLKSISERNNA